MKIYISPSNQFANLGAGSYGAEGARMNELADHLVPLLDRQGYEVVRPGPYTTLAARIAAANALKVDYYLALHSNAGGGRGCEVLIYGRGGQAEKLAQRIYNEVSVITPAADRGINVRPDLAELKSTAMPAVLLEVMFHDHPEEAAWIMQNMAAIAQAIARGVIAHCGGAAAPECDYKRIDIHALRIPPERFGVIYWGKGKRTTAIKDYACGPYQCSGTVPVGNVIGGGIDLAPRNHNLSAIWVDKDNRIGVGKVPPANVRDCVSGIPLLLAGRPCTLQEALAEGWDTSPLYPTTHSLLATDGQALHYYVVSSTAAAGAATYSEMLSIAQHLGHPTVLMCDGGGSTILDIGGNNVVVSEGNRQLAALIKFGG